MTLDPTSETDGVEADRHRGAAGFGWRRLQKVSAVVAIASFVVPMVIDLTLEPFFLALGAPFAIGLLLALKWPRVAAIWLGVFSLAFLLISVPFLGGGPDPSRVGARLHTVVRAGFGQCGGRRRRHTVVPGVLGAQRPVTGTPEDCRHLDGPDCRRLGLVDDRLRRIGRCGSRVGRHPGDRRRLRLLPRRNQNKPTHGLDCCHQPRQHAHTFTITELGVDLNLPPDSIQRVTFTADPGTYRFYCTLHPDMEGQLRVG